MKERGCAIRGSPLSLRLWTLVIYILQIFCQALNGTFTRRAKKLKPAAFFGSAGCFGGQASACAADSSVYFCFHFVTHLYCHLGSRRQNDYKLNTLNVKFSRHFKTPQTRGGGVGGEANFPKNVWLPNKLTEVAPGAGREPLHRGRSGRSSGVGQAGRVRHHHGLLHRRAAADGVPTVDGLLTDGPWFGGQGLSP